MTHTYAILEVSRATFEEIAQKLKAAGYDEAFIEIDVIDMHGIAVSPIASPERDAEERRS